MKKLLAVIIVYCFCLSGLRAEEGDKNKRKLWEIKTGVWEDRVQLMLPVQGNIVGMSARSIAAYDGTTGKLLWKYTANGEILCCPYNFSKRPHISIVTAIDDRIIVAPPHNSETLTASVMAIRLSDGKVIRRVKLEEEFGFPDNGYMYRTDRFTRQGSDYGIFWAVSKNWDKSQVMVINLHTWKSELRFNLDAEVKRDMDIFQGHLYGIMHCKDESFYRAFTVNLKNYEAYTVPMRCNGSFITYPAPFVLPNGDFLLYGGRFSVDCSYECPIPICPYEVTSNGYYTWNSRGISKLDPDTGRKSWQIDLGYTGYSFLWVTENEGWTVIISRGHVYAVNAETGELRLALQAHEIDDPLYDTYFSTSVSAADICRKTRFACDNKRIYYASPYSLKAYSLQAINPDKPDPYDPGDPAFTLRKTREAMQKGEYQNAMKHLYGIAVQVRLRPSMHAEATGLFSQLSRSQIPKRYPREWEKLIISDGWIAGNLFLEPYKKSATKSSIVALSLSGKKGLETAAAMLDRKVRQNFPYKTAAEAHEILTGKYPYEKVLKNGPWYAARDMLSRIISDPVFGRILPILKKAPDVSDGVVPLPPHQIFALIPKKTNNKELKKLIEVVKHQLKTQKNKEGEPLKFEIWGKKQ